MHDPIIVQELYYYHTLPIPFLCSPHGQKSRLEPNTKASQIHVLFIEAQNYPFYPRLCQLHHFSFTFCQQFVDIVYKLKPKYDIVTDHKVDSHTVNGSFFDLEPSHLFWIMVFEFERNVAVRSSLAYKFNLDDFYFSWLVFFQSLFIDCSQKVLFIFFQRLVIFILCKLTSTRLSISERLTLKF